MNTADAKGKLLWAYRRGRQLLGRLTGTDYPLNRMDPTVLRQVISANRQALQCIPTWIEPGMLENSVFGYGITPESRANIGQPLDDSCTYTDLLVYFGWHLKKPPCYLELGVSVGKTFWQIMNSCRAGRLVGFDIEELSPPVGRHLRATDRREWEPMVGSLKRTPSSFANYRHDASKSEVDYLCGDIFDPRCWEMLRGHKFNLVLSDALHTAEALDNEWDKLLSLQLLDTDECVIVWDDLNGPMHDWFLTRRKDISASLGISLESVRTLFVNGWLGRREPPHRIGLAVKGDFFTHRGTGGR